MHKWDEDSFDWPLTPESVVVEIGGFKGRWAAEIARRYNPVIHIFEPQRWARTHIAQAMEEAGASRWTLHGYGIGTETAEMPITSYGTDAASLVKGAEYQEAYPEDGRDKQEGKGLIVAAREALDPVGPIIDVMLMNIEGFEFTLIPYLIERSLLRRMRAFMVQFHDGIVESPTTAEVRAMIERDGFEMLWDYGATLSAWRRLP